MALFCELKVELEHCNPDQCSVGVDIGLLESIVLLESIDTAWHKSQFLVSLDVLLLR